MVVTVAQRLLFLAVAVAALVGTQGPAAMAESSLYLRALVVAAVVAAEDLVVAAGESGLTGRAPMALQAYLQLVVEAVEDPVVAPDP